MAFNTEHQVPLVVHKFLSSILVYAHIGTKLLPKFSMQAGVFLQKNIDMKTAVHAYGLIVKYTLINALLKLFIRFIIPV